MAKSGSEKEIRSRQSHEISEREALGVADCVICDNTGVVLRKAGDVECGYRCQCIDEFLNKRRIRDSGLKDVIEALTFDSFVADTAWQKNMKSKAMEFAIAHEGSWFYVGGAVGCGKTHVCTAICGEIMRKGPLRYMPWRELAPRLKASITDGSRYAELLEPYKETEVLYIDDLFKGGATEADAKLAFELLDYRYVRKTATIISTEWFIDEISNKIDDAIGSRIFERSRGYKIQIKDADGSKNYRFVGA